MDDPKEMDAASAAPDLPALTASDRALVGRYPLPGATPDALVNKRLLASALDVSPTTLDAWLLEGLPYASKGTNGRSYQFRLSVAYAWRQAREAREEAEKKFSEDAVAQLRLELMGGSADGQSRAALSPKEQAELLAVEAAYMKAAQLRRDLIPASEVAAAFEAYNVAVRDGIDAAPDLIGRELGLDGASIASVQTILDDLLREAREACARLMEGEDG